MVTTITSSSFHDLVLANDRPFLLDVYADWCGPCKMMAPVIEALSDSYQGKIQFGKLNIDENPEVAEKYRIISIPTLLLFKNGELVDTIVGLTSAPELRTSLNQILKSS